jgi:hypothetical protein
MMTASKHKKPKYHSHFQVRHSDLQCSDAIYVIVDRDETQDAMHVTGRRKKELLS